MRSYDRGSLGERGFREWDLALPDGEADGAFDELSSEFEFLREYVATFGQLNLPVARFLLRHRDRWWRIAFARVDAVPEAAEGPGSALARVSVSAGYGTAAPGELSPREVEIATLITAGLADKEIALRLGTSPRTVSTQISRLLARHELPTRTSLAAVITGEGWCLLPVPGPVLRDLTLPAFILDAAMRAPKSPGMLERRRMTAPASPLVSTGRVTRAPLRVGLLVTSGAFSDDGLEAAHGAELALAQATRMYRGANARAFEPIRIAVDPLSPESVAQGLRQLAAEDVDAVMSTYASALDPTIFEFAAEYGRPFLHTNSWTDSARRVAQDPTRFAHTFQTSPTELSYTSGLMTYLRRARDADQLRTPKVSIIELDGFGCSLTAGNIHDELAAAGIAVGATVAVGLAVESPAQVAERALRSDPGLVIVSHLSVDVAIELQRALRAISQHTPVFHLYTPSIPRFFEELGEDGDGVIWSTITGRTQDLLGQRFSEGYRREFGAAPGWSQSSAAYDQAQLLAQGFLLSGSRHAADVSDTLRHIVHRGVNGTYALGGPGQTVAGYPFDSPDPTLTTPTVTYRYAGGQMTVIA